MRKRIAMVLLGLSLAVGTPAATNMFPTVSVQTVQAAGKTGWTQESGTWYFYKDGVKQTGWQTWDGKKYYLNADGTMKANEWMIDTDGSVYYFRSWGGAYLNCKARINGRSYTFGADSKVQGSQWVVKGGKWYLVKDGKIATGWQTWDGNKYYMNSDGSMRSNEWRLDDTGKIRYLCSWGGAYKSRSAKINGRSYTFNSAAEVTNMQWIVMDGQWKLAKDGKIATGWQTWDNNRYYLNADGTMKANESFTDGGKTYFFCSWGGAYKNCWQTWNGKKYYLHDNGAAYQNEWLKTGGKWYWFQADSTMAVNTSFTYKDNLYFVDGNGIMLSGCWKEENGAKYYIRSWGGACKDMQMKISGKTYYFGSNCKMVTDQTVNGNYYGKDGALTTKPEAKPTETPSETVYATSVTITPNSNLELTEVGQTLQLAATVYPENATNKAVKWTSDDPEVASVDENGLVTVHKKNGMRKVIISADAMGSKPNGGVVGRYVEVKINIPYTNEEALGMTVYDQEVSRKIFDLVNEERVKEGHAAMIWDDKHCYPRSVAAAGYHIMRSITQPGYGTSDNLALHGGRQNGCGGGLSYTDSDDLARQIFNLWMSSPGHKANQMDDYNAYGAIAVMYGQPQEYNGRKIVNFSAVFSFSDQDYDYATTWEHMDDGMSDVLGMTENDYYQITNYFIR